MMSWKKLQPLPSEVQSWHPQKKRPLLAESTLVIFLLRVGWLPQRHAGPASSRFRFSLIVTRVFCSCVSSAPSESDTRQARVCQTTYPSRGNAQWRILTTRPSCGSKDSVPSVAQSPRMQPGSWKARPRERFSGSGWQTHAHLFFCWLSRPSTHGDLRPLRADSSGGCRSTSIAGACVGTTPSSRAASLCSSSTSSCGRGAAQTAVAPPELTLEQRVATSSTPDVPSPKSVGGAPAPNCGRAGGGAPSWGSGRRAACCAARRGRHRRRRSSSP
mmetsp:Transcript_21929/g.75359  ORF Transcript_21929/g.75359 Transcript_21929/m.75359 type:complete len:273 (-) Transcript_21929:1125-1943(-)